MATYKPTDTMGKIQELTDKLYREGVEKGESEGKRIVEEAEAEAGRLLADAQREASEIVEKARKQAQELDANTKAELRLYAGQALSALKAEVANAVSGRLAKDAAKALAGDKEFMGRFMVAMAQHWAEGGDMVISAPDAEALTAYFRAHAKKMLDKGLKIEKVNGKSASFSISPADGAYKVDFGEEEFEAYFKDFLRPKLVEMLF